VQEDLQAEEHLAKALMEVLVVEERDIRLEDFPLKDLTSRVNLEEAYLPSSTFTSR
jgi:hypothetical protein